MATVKATVWTILNAVIVIPTNAEGQAVNPMSGPATDKRVALTIRGTIQRNGQATKSSQLILHRNQLGTGKLSDIVKVNAATNTVTVTRVENRKGRGKSAPGTGFDTLAAFLK